MPTFDYTLTVAAAPLHPATKAPVIDLGRESHTTLNGSVIDSFKDPSAAEDLFLAMMHRGAKELWDREIKAQWFPQAPPSPGSTKEP